MYITKSVIICALFFLWEIPNYFIYYEGGVSWYEFCRYWISFAPPLFISYHENLWMDLFRL